MDNNELKAMWQDVHSTCHEKGGINMEDVKGLNHSKIITGIISDQKLKILLYSIFLAIYGGLMAYAFVYLGLRLSVYSILPLSVAGLFILIKLTSEIYRYIVLTKTADNKSISETLEFFQVELNKIKKIDFLSGLFFYYSFAIGTTWLWLKDIGGIKRLSTSAIPLPFIVVLILMLLFIPWIIKYQHNQRYKKLYESLSESSDFLKEES